VEDFEDGDWQERILELNRVTKVRAAKEGKMNH
jgi:hypothetical protein